jgi:hypothetical protein
MAKNIKFSYVIEKLNIKIPYNCNKNYKKCAISIVHAPFSNNNEVYAFFSILTFFIAIKENVKKFHR